MFIVDMAMVVTADSSQGVVKLTEDGVSIPSRLVGINEESSDLCPVNTS